jgi:hypothetical protein
LFEILEVLQQLRALLPRVWTRVELSSNPQIASDRDRLLGSA